MADAETIIFQIGLAGQDDVVQKLAEVGQSGAEAFAQLGGHVSEIAKFFGELSAAVLGTGAAMTAWVAHTANAVDSMNALARQSGFTITEFSALQGALAELGADSEGFTVAFRRMGAEIEAVWAGVVESTRTSINDITNAQFAVRDARFGVAQADRSAQQAELALFDAREKAREANRAARLPGSFGPIPTAQDRLNNAAARADLELKAAEEAVAEAQLKRAEAAQKAKEAEEKLIETQRNSIQTLQAAVQSIEAGRASVQSASQGANLTFENVLKGIVANAGPAAEVIKNFQGGLLNLTGQTPTIREFFFQLADFMKNSGDETLNTALSVRLLGRGVSEDLVVAMKGGRAELERYMAQMERLGFTLSNLDQDVAVKFKTTFVSLSDEISRTLQQAGLQFAPAFTEGFQKVKEALEGGGRASIVESARNLAEQLRPIIGGIFDLFATGKTNIDWLQALYDGFKTIGNFITGTLTPAVVGLFAALGGTQLNPGTVAEEWRKTFVAIGEAVGSVGKTVRSGIDNILTAFSEAATLIKGAFGDKVGNDLGIALVAGVAAAVAIFGPSRVIGALFSAALIDGATTFGQRMGAALVLGLSAAFTASPVGRLILGVGALYETLEGVRQQSVAPARTAGRIQDTESDIEARHTSGQLTDEQYRQAHTDLEETKQKLKDAVSPLGTNETKLAAANKSLDEVVKKFGSTELVSSLTATASSTKDLTDTNKDLKSTLDVTNNLLSKTLNKDGGGSAAAHEAQPQQPAVPRAVRLDRLPDGGFARSYVRGLSEAVPGHFGNETVKGASLGGNWKWDAEHATWRRVEGNEFMLGAEGKSYYATRNPKTLEVEAEQFNRLPEQQARYRGQLDFYNQTQGAEQVGGDLQTRLLDEMRSKLPLHLLDGLSSSSSSSSPGVDPSALNSSFDSIVNVFERGGSMIAAAFERLAANLSPPSLSASMQPPSFATSWAERTAPLAAQQRERPELAPVTINIGDRSVGGLYGTEDAIGALQQAATERQDSSLGQSPSWDSGR